MTRRAQLTELEIPVASKRLRRCVLFSDLDEGRFSGVLEHSRSAVLGEDEILFEQGQAAREIFLLESGQIKLALVSPEGQEKIIDLISPGVSFAEAVIFSRNRIYPVTATAIMASQVWCIDATYYTGILRESVDACFAVMAQMSRRLHWQIAEIDRLTLHNATSRVVNYLLEQTPSTHLVASEIQLDTPKHVIASRLSITPETLSRTFAKLSREGHISIVDNIITINDIEGLRRYAQIGSSPV
jgi:CRP-like cAMP-binding protein